MLLPNQARPVARNMQNLKFNQRYSSTLGLTPSADCTTPPYPCGGGTGLLCCNGTGTYRDQHVCCNVKTHHCDRSAAGVPFCQPN